MNDDPALLPSKERAGPRIESTDLTRKRGGGFPPVELAIRLLERRRIGSLGIVLGRGLQITLQVCRKYIKQQFGAQCGEPSLETPPGFAVENGGFALGENGPGVHAGVQEHDGHAGLKVSMKNGGLHRRCASPSRKQRGVHVQTAKARKIEDA